MVSDLIKVPRINALGLKGAEKAPNLILEELKKNYSGFSSLTLEEIHVDNSNVSEADELIYKNAKKEFEIIGDRKLAFIGGDHSISYPLVRAFGESFNFDESFLIVFDAHSDCCKPGKEPTHEEWLRAVIEFGIKPENVIVIGLRKIWKEEKEFLRQKGIKYFDSSDIVSFESLEGIADSISEKANGKNVYISLDIDVLEPSEAPGVSYPESGGLNFRELLYLLRRFWHVPGFKAMDFVEVIPEKDEKFDYRTIKVSARILQSFLEFFKN